MVVQLSNDIDALFTVWRKCAAPEAVRAIEVLIHEGRDCALCRINAPDFAASQNLGEEHVIGAFLHACMVPDSAYSSWSGTCFAPAAAECSNPEHR
jgi:hypothetical protein